MSPKTTITPIIMALLSFSYALAWTEATDLTWSTFLGGSGNDWGHGIALDNSANVYVTGGTYSADFPTTDGAFDATHGGGDCDAFVAKLDPTGNALDYATFLGGRFDDHGYSLAVDNSGSAYITGQTYSADFPTTIGAFDVTHNSSLYDSSDVFIAKLNPTGNDLAYSTFLGGNDYDLGFSVAVSGPGHAHVTGWTKSSDFPTTAEAFDITQNGGYDVFVVKVGPTGDALDFSTFLGGSGADEGWGIDVDNSGNVYVAGNTASSDFPTTAGAFDASHNGKRDAFVVKLNSTGDALDYATFLGGGDSDYSHAIAVDNSGNACVTGQTKSSDFPATAAAFDTTHNGGSDVFVAKVSPMGNALGYATFVGGGNNDWGNSIAADTCGNAYVTGGTYSTNFPTTAGAFSTTFSGYVDAFAAKLNPTGNALDYASLLGGVNYDYGFGIAVDNSGNTHMTGGTQSDDFPTIGGAFDGTFNGSQDVFVAQLSLGGTHVVSESLGSPLLKAYTLHQNFPNPFNASTEIRYQIPADSHVILRIYNTLGQQVRTLMDTDQPAGEHAVHWNGQAGGGQKVASGIYFCRLKASDFNKTIKMVLVK